MQHFETLNFLARYLVVKYDSFLRIKITALLFSLDTPLDSPRG